MKHLTKILLIGIYAFLGPSVFAQSEITFTQLFALSEKDTKKDSLYEVITVDDISEIRGFYQTLLTREFERILTGSNTSIGNFGSLSTGDDLLQLNGMIKLWERSTLGLNINGGVTEGIAELISGGETSPNVNAKLTLNFRMFNEDSKFTLNATEYQQLKNSIEEKCIETLKKRDEIDLALSVKQKELTNAKYTMSIANEKLIQLRPIYHTLKLDKNLQGTFEYNKRIDSLSAVIDSYVQDSLMYVVQLKTLNREIEHLSDSSANTAKKQLLEERKVAYAASEKEKFPITYYKIRWFSLSAQIKNRAFKSFADSLAYGEQFTKQSYNQVIIEFRRNRYVSSSKTLGSYYLSFGLRYSISDNFEDLTKVTVEEAKPIGVTQTVKSSTTGYVGDYEKGIMRNDVFVDFYWFLNGSRTFAFHINPIVIMDLRTNGKSQLNSRFGLLFEFQKPNKEGFFNAELFYDISKIGTKLADDERFDDRTLLGVNLNIPFQFKPSN
jgi:hypothetical protein